MAAGPSSHVWSLGPDEALRALAADARGLTAEEADRRFRLVGPNEIREERGVSPAALLLRQFRSPLIYILLAAGGVTVILAEFIDAAVIGAVLVINAAIGFVQEHRAESAMAALRHLARARARILRDGREQEVDAALLVPGDIVLLEAGAKVPADCRILHAAALEADESLLTGESATVAKSASAVGAEAAVADRTSMLFMGTVITHGHGRAVVAATGAQTELGEIADVVRATGETETPLQRRMARLARIIGIAVLVAATAGLALGVAAGEDAGELFLAVVALAVSAIPEGLPIVLTVALAISVRRMSRRNAIVRRLPAVEALGSCTVIGSDKTGTLTENRMTVRRIDAGGFSYTVTGTGHRVEGAILLGRREAAAEEGSPLHMALLAGVLCNDASAVPADDVFDVRGDPTEIALLVAAAKTGLFKDELEDRFVRFAEIPFDPERRFAATFNRSNRGSFVFVKGAPEEVLSMCTHGIDAVPPESGRVLLRAEEMAGEGLRVLALAFGRLEDVEDVTSELAHEHLAGLTFLGLVGMLDPPREEALRAVRDCQSAGIRVIMITGDHARTACAIGQSIGIGGPEPAVLAGAQLEHLDDAGLERAVQEVSIYARAAPQHKYRIVSALRRLGETVAVTGDGVNDAPALKAADIGTAMGLTGTDVAKDAADMVVADDDFASIVAAVEEGRIAFDNVRKTTFFLISSGLGEVIAVLSSIAFRFQLPFLPAQLLWLNLVTNGIQDVALAFEPGEKDVLRRPPRPRREGVISTVLWERTVVAGMVMAAGTLLLFLLELAASDELERARTVALTTMVLFQVIHVGNSRSEHASAFAKSPFSNRFLFVGTSLALTLHVGALYLPPTQVVLRVEPLDAGTWLRMIAVASTVLVAVEIHKLLRRRA